MKWSVFVCLLVCLARFCEGGALRCSPGVIDCVEGKETQTTKTSGSETAETQCLAGTEWESNCHLCRCSNTGVAECLKTDTCDQRFYAEPALCKANTTFKRDCNTCVCLDNGLGLCTLKGCSILIPDEFKEFKELSEESKSEKDEEIKTKTHVLVIPIGNFEDEENFVITHGMLKRTTICKPYEEFMRDCNPCKCAADGLSYSCTRNECLEVDMNKEVEVFMASEGVDHIERHSVCPAGETFEDDCNTCRCNILGTDYSCTKTLCTLPPDVEVLDGFKV